MLPFWHKRDDATLPVAPALLPLTPKYDPEHHGMYLGAIETALTGPESKDVKNLALSGGYGVGKSSILIELARRHDSSVITISLSTLGFSDEPAETEGVAKTASTRTNRIQKEIVKQLLYSQDPVKVPGSRYKRVTRFRVGREIGFAALLAVPLTLVFLLSGWSSTLGTLARLPVDVADVVNIPIFIAAVGFIVGVRKAMHNRIHIERISTGGTTIALSAQSATFFDEYLDEIVYFFERTNIDLVIFEDIDRFDDPHIFESLRALNSLLNRAKQLDGRVIRFVYAIKDSIFDELGQRAAQEELEAEDDDAKPRQEKPREDDAAVELARANRTKFFDQVIPVVPFVTHLSARNLLKKTLDGEVLIEGQAPVGGIAHKVTNDLVDLVGRFIADMRLIKNIRNEFAIFRELIIVNGSLDLTDDGVLAMVLYKSTHLTDFERIKHRQSDLDKLYDDYRALVNNSIERLEAQVRADRNARSKVRAASSWSTVLGKNLIVYLDDHLAHFGGRLQGRGFSGEPLDDARLQTPEVWRRIAAGETVVVNYVRQTNGYGNMQFQSTFTRDQLARALNDQISPDAWAIGERQRLDKRIAVANTSIAFLRTADMKQLLDRTEFTLSESGTDNLAEILQRRLGSELARQLVRYGYIDQNFTLYTSTFHDVRVSAAATNFIMKNVDRHRIDMAFKLSDADVESVLREKGRTVLGDDSAYNLSFLNYLLRRDPAGAEVLVDRLAHGGDKERALIHSYLASGDDPRALVERLAKVWSGVFSFLVSEAGLEDARRDELVDLALRSMSDDVEYVTDVAISEFVADTHPKLETFTSAELSAETAVRVASYLQELEAELPSLVPLSTTIRAAIVAAGVYTVNRDNLLLALASDEPNLALDAMKEKSVEVYRRVLRDLSAYLDALIENEVSIASEGAFLGVVADVLEVDATRLAGVVKAAAGELQVHDLEDVAVDAWPALAGAERFPASFANVTKYIDQYGLDAALAALLASAGEIELEGESAEGEKLALALAVIGAKEVIPPADVRSRLVRSLELESAIAADAIPVEPGELVGRLIGDQVMEDDAASFARLAADDWTGREYAISRSDAFTDFMTSTELPVAQLVAFIRSTVIDDGKKRALVDRLSEFTGGATQQTLVEIADYALSSGHGMTVANLARLAPSIGAERTLSLLQPSLAHTDGTELEAVLNALGGDYAKLAGRTGDRPRFDRTSALEALLDRLEQLDWVSSIDDQGMRVRVNMRKPS